MYWGFGIVATFFFFGISAIGDVGWLANSANRTSVNEFTMLVFFFLAISLFLVVGIFTIIEIFYSMKKEFEDIKKKQKEVKGTTSYGISTVLVRGDAKVKEKKHEPQNE
jgi:putative Mn2+ efflux pump MntP